MNKHDYKQNAYYMLYLIRCVLHDKIPAKDKLDKMDLAQLYEVAKAHSLSIITAYSLESADIDDKEFKEAKTKAIRKTIYFDIERTAVLNELEKSKIWYLPLKGIILKDYYFKSSMREMCDNDILIDKNRIEDIKSIMIDLGFKMEHDDLGHDLAFMKEPVCNFEMHTELFGVGYNEIVNGYYNNIHSRLLKDEDNQFGYHFSNEDFYIFMIAHEYKHFYYSGTGLRSLLDTYVYVNHFYNQLNWKYIYNELKKLGIDEYEKLSRSLSTKLFSGEQLNREENIFLDCFIFAGTYGNEKSKVINRLKKNNKLQYIRNRVFLPMDYIEKHHPFFYRNKVLLPLLPIYRLMTGIVTHRKGLQTELKALIKHRR